MIRNYISLTLAAALLASASVSANVYQSTEAESAYRADGSSGSATQNNLLEIKEVDGATLARIKGSMTQWGYITYWMGLPTPAGASTIRFKVYNTGEPTGRYIIYIKDDSGQQQLGEFVIPADAPKNEFVNVDFPVNKQNEWAGIIVKKASTDNLPSPWIDSVSVLVE